MEDDWWTSLFRAADWAQARRLGIAHPPVPLAAIDLAAGALADPVLADLLERERIDLDFVETALVGGVADVQDLDQLAGGCGEIARARDADDVTAVDAFVYLLSNPHVARAVSDQGLVLAGDRPAAASWLRAASGVGRMIARAWPVTGRLPHDTIVVEDHPTVTRAFVFELLTKQGELTAVAALRAIRRIETTGQAAVIGGRPGSVDARYERMRSKLQSESSLLVMRRVAAR